MASLDSLLTRKALAQGIVLQDGTDEPVALRLRYVGTGSVTSVTVTTGTNIVMVTTDGGTDTYAFGTFTTLGALADAINADGIFEAKILDDLRSSATATQYVNGAITAGTDANGVVVWDVRVDTSAALRIPVALTANRDFDQPKRRVDLKEIVYSVNMGTAAADSVQIWRRRGTVETKIMGLLSVDTTETTIRFANGEGSITGREGDEIIVLVKDAATLADAAGNFVRVVGTIE
jgi:hypothetical protein